MPECNTVIVFLPMVGQGTAVQLCDEVSFNLRTPRESTPFLTPVHYPTHGSVCFGPEISAEISILNMRWVDSGWQSGREVYANGNQPPRKPLDQPEVRRIRRYE